ncbi:MAG TPA: hypothetical protein DEO65_03245 [Bacillus bacterium]|nr:hypothetical protein [Bacillus sp. (in: firmicutes)]
MGWFCAINWQNLKPLVKHLVYKTYMDEKDKKSSHVQGKKGFPQFWNFVALQQETQMFPTGCVEKTPFLIECKFVMTII